MAEDRWTTGVVISSVWRSGTLDKMLFSTKVLL